MARVKVSPKYQVVIPQEIRESLDLKPGQEVEVMLIEDRIQIIPVRPMVSMRGYLKHIGAPFERGGDRPL
ncbi:MAG: AbrB/MazE/SpoVT family DNA-binding domain-containing protein [Rhodothermales bacterium]